jgi:hypothetical protein
MIEPTDQGDRAIVQRADSDSVPSGTTPKRGLLSSLIDTSRPFDIEGITLWLYAIVAALSVAILQFGLLPQAGVANFGLILYAPIIIGGLQLAAVFGGGAGQSAVIAFPRKCVSANVPET